MTKVLYLGDPHVQVSNLDESYRLMEFVLEQSTKHKVDRITILGDLFHTMSVVRVEAIEFWDRCLGILDKEFDTVILTGNHDIISHHSKSSSLSVFNTKYTDKLKIVSNPVLLGIFGYLPYIHSKEEFLSEAQKLVDQGAKVLVCHQTLHGAKFESGMPAHDGVDTSSLKVPLIISGHHHNRQRFNNVIYPGNSRWLTSSDRNEEKGLWCVTYDLTGEILHEEFLDTSHVCTPIYGLQWKEGDPKPTLIEHAKNTIELVGTSDWIAKQKALLKGTCSITTRVTDTKKVRWKPTKSENTLETFILQKYTVSSGLTKEKLLEFIKKEGFDLV